MSMIEYLLKKHAEAKRRKEKTITLRVEEADLLINEILELIHGKILSEKKKSAEKDQIYEIVVDPGEKW